MQTFPTFSLLIPRKFVSLRPTQVARKGERVKLWWKKGRLRTLSLVVSTSQLETSSKETQLERPLWVYCTLSVLLTTVSICLSVVYRVAYLDEGAMRRPRRRDKRNRAPTSFRI